MVVRLNAVERAFVDGEAAKAGLPVSTYARAVLTRRKIAARQTPIEELNRCGVNLHQIVRTLNFGNSVPNDIADVLEELNAAIAKVGASYDAQSITRRPCDWHQLQGSVCLFAARQAP
ncbi:MAG: hypothetical protein ABJT31_11450 [Hyphomicrobiales bacterium]